MRLNIPVGVDIAGIVLLDTSGLNLLEAPLWEIDIACSQIASKRSVL